PAARGDQVTGPEDAWPWENAARHCLLNFLRHVAHTAEIANARDAAVEVQTELLDASNGGRCVRVAVHREVVAALLAEMHVEIDEARHHVETRRVDRPVDFRWELDAGCRPDVEDAVAT